MLIKVMLKFSILLTLNYNLEDTESAIKNKLKNLLTELRGFKFVTTLVLVHQIESDDKTKYDTFHSYSKAEIIINERDIDDVFESIYTTIISNIRKSFGKGSGWINHSVIENSINISRYNLLAESSYIKFSKEVEHSGKGLINIQNIDDNE